MFDKFGEFDSAEELNRAAAAQKEEGDEEALKAICRENGIDEEEAEDYMDDCMEELCTPLMAALGKLKVESVDLQLKGILQEWVDELGVLCANDDELAMGVRRKGHDLAGYIAKLADCGYEHRAKVDKQITAKTDKIKNMIGSHDFEIGIPDKRARKEIAYKYYTGK